MEKFTYQDYLKYTKKKYSYTVLKEESIEYRLEKIHQYKDKGYKMILDDKKEAVQLINKTLQIENTEYAISKEELEKYNSSFITQDFKSKESDLVYKKKGEDIFFLIEQQSQIDYSMAYRVMNYCIEIIRSTVDKKKLKSKGYKMPVVYPIVLYTGKRKWNAKKYLEECQIKLKGVEGATFASYNLIDINNFTEEELWKENNFLSKMLLLEKVEEEGEIEEYLSRIEKENLSSKEIHIIVQMMCGSLDRKIGQKAIKEFIEKMKNKKGGNNMGLTALERYWDNLIDKKLEQGMKQGIKQGMERGMERGMEQGMKQGMEKSRNTIVLRMLKNKMDETTIKLMTEITQEELEEIKNKI